MKIRKVIQNIRSMTEPKEENSGLQTLKKNKLQIASCFSWSAFLV